MALIIEMQWFLIVFCSWIKIKHFKVICNAIENLCQMVFSIKKTCKIGTWNVIFYSF